jgi:hypothetical protein
VLGELDRIVAGGATTVYLVDDNFIGNQKAALELLPQLVAWQRARSYPLRLACEATLNIARTPAVLARMREAGFVTVFCGIETPEPHALRAIVKDQNLRLPILEAVQRINDHGMEAVAGIILGLDTDGPGRRRRSCGSSRPRGSPCSRSTFFTRSRRPRSGDGWRPRAAWWTSRRLGVRGRYRRTFWRMAGPALRQGRIEELIHVAVISHHLIEFTRDCLGGAGESSFYAPATGQRVTRPPLPQAAATGTDDS